MSSPLQIDFDPRKMRKPIGPYNYDQVFTGRPTTSLMMPWPKDSVRELAQWPDMIKYWIYTLISWSCVDQNYKYYNWQCSDSKNLYVNRTRRFSEFTKDDWNQWFACIDYDTPNLNPVRSCENYE